MGAGKSDYKHLGGERSKNGHDPVYSVTHWSNSITLERPKKATKRKLMLLLLDLIIVALLMKILPYLDSIKEFLVWAVGILYLSARTGLQFAKLIVFCSKNAQWLKDAWKHIKNNFNER